MADASADKKTLLASATLGSAEETAAFRAGEGLFAVVVGTTDSVVTLWRRGDSASTFRAAETLPGGASVNVEPVSPVEEFKLSVEAADYVDDALVEAYK